MDDDPQFTGAADPVFEALRALVGEILAGGYTDGLGHPIANSVAFLDALELVELRTGPLRA